MLFRSVFPLENGICPGCAKGKMHNKPFPPSEKRALKPFDLIHADLIELPIRSYHKKKWVCTVTLKTVPMIGYPEEIEQAHHGKMLQI